MKNYVKLTLIIAAIVLSTACSSNDKTKNSNTETVELAAPGNIRIHAKVLEISTDNPRYMKVVIDSVLARGSAFFGKVFKGDTVNAYFPQAFTKQQIKDNLNKPTNVEGLDAGTFFLTESSYRKFEREFYLVINTYQIIDGGSQ